MIFTQLFSKMALPPRNPISGDNLIGPKNYKILDFLIKIQTDRAPPGLTVCFMYTHQINVFFAHLFLNLGIL